MEDLSFLKIEKMSKGILFLPESYKRNFNGIKEIAESKDYNVCFYPKETIKKKLISATEIYKPGKRVCVGFPLDESFYNLLKDGKGFESDSLETVKLTIGDLMHKNNLVDKVLGPL